MWLKEGRLPFLTRAQRYPTPGRTPSSYGSACPLALGKTSPKEYFRSFLKGQKDSFRRQRQNFKMLFGGNNLGWGK